MQLIRIKLLFYAIALLAAPHRLYADSGTDCKLKMHGFLRSDRVEPILPGGVGWLFRIAYLAPEGSRVEAGEQVAEFEAQNLDNWLQHEQRQQHQQRLQGEAKIARLEQEIGELESQLKEQEHQLALSLVGVGTDQDKLQWIQSSRQMLIEKLDTQARKLLLKTLQDKIKRRGKVLRAVQSYHAKSMEMSHQRLRLLNSGREKQKATTRHGGTVVYRRIGRHLKPPSIGGECYMGQAPIEIVDDKRLYVQAFLREELRTQVDQGAKVKVRLESQEGVFMNGHVTKISPIVLKAQDWDRSILNEHFLYNIRAFVVTIQINNIPSAAKPNASVVVDFVGCHVP